MKKSHIEKHNAQQISKWERLLPPACFTLIVLCIVTVWQLQGNSANANTVNSPSPTLAKKSIAQDHPTTHLDQQLTQKLHLPAEAITALKHIHENVSQNLEITPYIMQTEQKHYLIFELDPNKTQPTEELKTNYRKLPATKMQSIKTILAKQPRSSA